MPVITAVDAIAFDTHGSTFTSFVRPSAGSDTLCAWRLDVPTGLVGVSHRPDREEVLLVLTGRLTVRLDGVTAALEPGSVALVPAGSEFAVDAGPEGGSAWVTTTSGLEATLPDGSTFAPPWAQ